jgi:thiosulfate/3-mercaptopyruvate sulfurtransferase
MTHTGKLISGEELANWIGHPDLRVVDCRFELTDELAGRRDYESGHIPGAVYAHLHDDLAAPVTELTGRHPLPDPMAFAGVLGRWGIQKNSLVVAYDGDNGAVAARLWWMLRWLGHDSAAVLDGGYQGWLQSGGPVNTGWESCKPTRFEPRIRRGMTLDQAGVANGLAGGSLLLIDVRARPRYLGETEPLDKVAGHIPGAVNLPFQRNLDHQGRFLAPRALRTIYQELAQAHPGKQLCFMCGSGVTACHSLLAMELAGLPGALLYPGSWSEWISDPRLPVARGE